MVCIRSDISQVVSMMSSYMYNSSNGHLHAVKWILPYILSTINVGIKFKQDKDHGQLVVDSDFEGYNCSTILYLFNLTRDQVNWRLALLFIVAFLQ